MKKILFALCLFAFGYQGFSQAPQGINYQGVARDNQGQAYSITNISVQITIQNGTGPVYQEHQTVTTDTFGLYNIVIGSAAAVVTNGSFASIPWSAGNLDAQVDIDPTGTASNWITISSMKLQSVPYALYAQSSGSGGGVTSLTGGTGIDASPSSITSTGSFSLAASGVTAGTYGGSSSIPVINVDNMGRITSASNQTFNPGNVVVAGTGLSSTTSSNTVTINASSSSPLWNAAAISSTPVSIGALATNDMLQFNGTNWVNVPPPPVLPSGTNGQMLFNNAGVWTPSNPSNLFFNGTSLGMGTASPGALIDLQSTGGSAPLLNVVTTGSGNSAKFSGGAGVQVDKIQIGGTTSSGYVLTSDPSGNASWQPSGGGGFWTQSTDTLYPTNPSARVAIGTTSPLASLHAVSSNTYATVYAANSSTAPAGYFESTGANGNYPALDVVSNNANGYGLRVNNNSGPAILANSGGPYAIAGNIGGGSGSAVAGWLRSGTTNGNGIYGLVDNTSTGLAGYFENQNTSNTQPVIKVVNGGTGHSAIFSGGSGVQIDSLEVQTNLHIPLNANSGWVLTSDIHGNASWLPPSGGGVSAVSVNAPLTNTGTSTAPVLSIPQSNSGTDGYLSKADWNTFNAKLTSVTSTAPLSGSGTAVSPLTMPLAGSTVDGYLSQADWNTFNAKLTSVTSTAPLSGSGTAVSPLTMPLAGSTADGYLSQADWNTFNAKLTSVTSTAPISGSGTAVSPLTMPQAGSTANGYLSQADWNTFNSKLTAVTAATPLSGNGTSGSPLTVPQAGVSTDGYLSQVDWNGFNSKLSSSLGSSKIFVGNAGNVATPVSVTGDVLLANTGLTTVTGLQGRSVSAAAPGLNQVLQYNGTNWAGASISTLPAGANGQMLYNNAGNWVATASTNLFFTGTNLGVGNASPTSLIDVTGSGSTPNIRSVNAGTISEAGTFTVTNAGNGAAALVAGTSGTGPAIVANSVNGNAINAATSGTAGSAGSFQNTNASNNSPVVNVTSGGAGPGVNVSMSGSGSAVSATTSSGSGSAGFFQVNNPANNNYAVSISSNANVAPALVVSNSGNGSGAASTFTVNNATNTAPAILVGTAGPGPAIQANGAVNVGTNFIVSSAGNIIKLNGVNTNFPNVQGLASTFLQNDGAGNLSWQPASAMAWSLNGNAGTVDGTNFIGTTDNIPLTLRVNNQRAARITSSSTSVTSFGYQAIDNATGNGNVAFGYQALQNPTGSYNTALGHTSLNKNTSGVRNVGVGMEALFNNSTGSNNVAVGFESMYYNTGGNDNTAMGTNALIAVTTGSSNTAIGKDAMSTVMTSTANTAVGWGALWNNDSPNNSSLGYMALSDVSTGANNTAVGFKAGMNSASANNNTFLGANSGLSSTTQRTNATAIGYNAKVDGDNALVLGAVGTLVGIGTPAPLAYLDVVNTATTGVTASFTSSNVSNASNVVNATANGTGYSGNFTGGSGFKTDGFTAAIRTFTGGTTTLTSVDYFVVVPGGASGTINLPTPNATNVGKVFIIKNISASVITVGGTTYISSSGATGQTTFGPSSVTRLISDGSAWQGW